jgi:hypothetical protein
MLILKAEVQRRRGSLAAEVVRRRHGAERELTDGLAGPALRCLTGGRRKIPALRRVE